MKVKAISHKDVRGKELLYIEMKTINQTLLINVGKKTYETIKEMCEAEEEREKDKNVSRETNKKNKDDMDIKK